MTSVSDPATLVSYSYNQQKALFWAGKPSAVIGGLSSVFLCYSILKDRDGLKKKVFRRLFLGLSMFHILLVLMAVLSTIPTPKGSFYGSMGSTASCSASGFFFHWIYSMTMVLNGSIGTYYFIAFEYNWSDLTIKKKVEPYLYAVAAIYPLLGAIMGVSFHMYNADPLLLQCYAAPAPLGCGEVGGEACTNGDNHRGLFIWMTGYIELNPGTALKLVTVAKISVKVFLQERKNKQRVQKSLALSSGSGHTTASRPSSTDVFSSMRRSNMSQSETTTPRKRPKKASLATETFIQSFFFLLSCFVPYCFGFLVKMFDLYWVKIPDDRMAPGWLFGLSMVSQIMFPLQGIINLLIFMRPNYMRRRRTHYEKESPWESAKASFFIAAGRTYQGKERGSTAVTTSVANGTRISLSRIATSFRSLGKSLSMEVSDHDPATRTGAIGVDPKSPSNDNDSGSGPYSSDEEATTTDKTKMAVHVECSEEYKDETSARLSVAKLVDDDTSINSFGQCSSEISEFHDKADATPKSAATVAPSEPETASGSERPNLMNTSIGISFRDEPETNEGPADGHISHMFLVDDEEEEDEGPADGHISGMFLMDEEDDTEYENQTEV